MIKKTSYGIRKIVFDSIEELTEKLNKLMAKRIILIESDVPDFTTTKQCVSVLFEYYE